MEAVLITRWLAGTDAVEVIDHASVSAVRERVRAQGAAIGLPDEATAKLVTAASELANNQLAHARGGRVAIRTVQRGDGNGLEVVAADRGDGIVDPTAALRGMTRSPAGGLGIGLAGVIELADEVDFDVRVGEGTCVWARKFATQVKRRSVGVYGRPIADEPRSGDDAAFQRMGDEIFVAVADGLGHGVDARTAATRAVQTALDQFGHPLEEIVERCHASLHGTRGAVLVLARVAPAGGFETSVVGDAAATVLGVRATQRFGGVSRVLGAPGHSRRARRDHGTIGPREVLALHSDGLTTKTALENDAAILVAHPIVVAHALVSRFARERDDAIVAVVG